jgi:parallel beta-helix repeat protein
MYATLLLVLGLLLFATPGTAKTVTMRPGEAVPVGQLQPGDTLALAPGTYAAMQGLPSGTSWSQPITVTSAPGGTATIQGIGLMGTEQYLIFDRVQLTGGGLFLNCEAHHIRLQHSEVGPITHPSNAVGISGCGSYLEVLNTKIHDVAVAGGCNQGNSNACYAVYWFGHDSLFACNEVANNDGYAFHIYWEGHGGQVNNNIIRNNRIHGNGFRGGSGGSGNIIITHGSGNKVVGNVITGNVMGVQVGHSCTNCEVSENTLSQNGGDAIQDGGANTVVSRNMIDGSGTGGATLAQGAECTAGPLHAPPRPAPYNLRAASQP